MDGTYVERYISFAVSTGVKVMVLYLLLGAGMSSDEHLGRCGDGGSGQCLSGG